MRFCLSVVYLVLCSSCAVLHHAQVGEIDSRVVLGGTKFEVLVSETGINLDEAVDIAKHFTNKKDGKALKRLQEFIGLFQMGPRTGNPIYFSPDYADNLVQAIYHKCPSGKISGLMAIRESNKYPVVSGEIVKLVGYCGKRRS